ncbi:MAG: patatin-like phospholipase family protein [Chloroflexi bacterium]|nr:patatin-like phospholipase family protein [Chloroflexota bacterium]
MTDRYKADAVFEGGGVKGIALVGALSEMEKRWRWENVAGASAGAVVAAFTAVGMTAADIRAVLDRIDLRHLRDEGWEDKLDRVVAMLNPLRLPLFGRVSSLLDHPISLLTEFGIFEGKRFEEMVREHLPPDVRTFGDLLHDPAAPTTGGASRYRYRLRVVASDITANRMLVLPQDIAAYGYDPDGLEIAAALRMSVSIPVFFEPYRLLNRRSGRTHLIVDGGLLSNYPVWLFDAPPGVEPEWPTFGFDLHDPADRGDGEAPWPEDVREIDNVFDFARAVWETLAAALERRHVPERHWARTVAIDSLGLKATDFDLSEDEKERLWHSGVAAARAFMVEWGDPEEGFEVWKSRYRGEVEEAQARAGERASP